MDPGFGDREFPCYSKDAFAGEGGGSGTSSKKFLKPEVLTRDFINRKYFQQHKVRNDDFRKNQKIQWPNKIKKNDKNYVNRKQNVNDCLLVKAF